MWRRCLKFYFAGGVGFGVQLGALTALVSGLGWNYLWATAAAVELALLHNFAWHERFTWRDRTRHDPRGTAGRLLRFHCTTGVVSLGGNLALMRLLAGALRINYLAANIATIAICSLANFLAAEFLVFRAAKKSRIS